MTDSQINKAGVFELVNRLIVLMSLETNENIIKEYDKIIMELCDRNFLNNNKAKYRRIRKR